MVEPRAPSMGGEPYGPTASGGGDRETEVVHTFVCPETPREQDARRRRGAQVTRYAGRKFIYRTKSDECAGGL